MSSPSILISEVGPRDGLQSVKSIMPTAAKLAWIRAEAAAGVREIEVGSFVPASVLPQLADTAEVVAGALQVSGLKVAVLVPNLKGAERAVAAGAHKITLPFSVSETHSLRNVRRSHAEMFREVEGIVALLCALPRERRPQFEVGLSTAFGCTIEGPVAEAKVLAIGERCIALGADELGLSDTTGFANPAQVRRLVKALAAAVGAERASGIHLHNTRGQGLANALAAIEAGITTLDASLGGLGGCPFAPGASGNIVTEDLVFMLEAMGLGTGIDLPRLLDLRREVAQSLPGEDWYGYTAAAGLPKGFVGTTP